MALLSSCKALFPLLTLFVSRFALVVGGAESPWYVGCYNWPPSGFTRRLYQVPAGQGNNPVLCSKSCLDEGYRVAALSGDRCRCADLSVEGLLANLTHAHSQNTGKGEDQPDAWNPAGCSEGSCGRSPPSSSEEHLSKELHDSFMLQCPRRCYGSWCLPAGEELGTVAVYRTLGPYIRNISLCTVADRAQAGKPFLLQISGYLAASPWQPTGLKGLGEKNFSLVDVEISWSPSVLRAHRVAAQENGYFALSAGWMSADPGMHYINITVSNGISSQFGSMRVRVVLPRPAGLEVKLLQEAQDIPSCIPFSVQHAQVAEKVFLGANATIRAVASMGRNLHFFWHFSDDGHSLHLEPDCLPRSNCLSCDVNHTFRKEGVHAVTVNVSNTYGWIEKRVHIVAVKRMVSGLTLSSPGGCILAVGQTVPLELQLVTTMRHLLILDATLEPGVTCSYSLAGNSTTVETSRCPWLIHPYRPPSCRLRVQLLHSYSSAGLTSVSITVFSPADPQRTVLPCPLRVYEPISDLGPAQGWSYAIASGVNITLRVISPADRTDSTVHWTVTRGNFTILNQTFKDWALVLSLPSPGQYLLGVNASNPISYASFQTQLLVQDVISGFSLLPLTPKYVQTGSPVMVQTTVASGTDVTYLWRFGETLGFHTGPETVTHVFSQPGAYTVTARAVNNVSQAPSSSHLEFVVQDAVGDITVHMPSIIAAKERTGVSLSAAAGTSMSVAVFANSSLVCSREGFEVGAEMVLYLVFEQTGPALVTVQVSNRVSAKNITQPVLVLQELHTMRIEATHRPVAGKSVILSALVNGHVPLRSNYLYTWQLPHNQMVRSGSPLLSLSCDDVGPHFVNVTVMDSTSSISTALMLNVTGLSAAPFLSHPAIVSVRTPVLFSVQNASRHGSPVVNLGDGNETTVFSPGGSWFVFNHTYSRAAIYRVTVEADGEKILSSLIDVQEPVEGLRLVGPDTFSLPVSPIRTSVITWTAEVSRGSSYVYQWTVSDGKKSVSVMGTAQFAVEVCEPAELRTEVTVKNEISGLTASLSTRVVRPITGVIELQCDYKLTSQSQATPPRMDVSRGPLRPFISFCPRSSNRSIKRRVRADVEEALNNVHLALTTPAVTRLSGFINVTASVHMGGDVTFQWQVLLPNSSVYTQTDKNTSISSLMFQTYIPGTHKVSALISSCLYDGSVLRELFVKVRIPIGVVSSRLPFGKDHAVLQSQPDGSHTTEALTFGAQVLSNDVNFTFSFGDRSPLIHVEGSSDGLNRDSVASVSHRFTEEGTFFITVTAYNEFYNASAMQPFYVEKMPSDLQLISNSSFVYQNEVAVFSAQLASGTNVTYTWNMGDETPYVTGGAEVHRRFLISGMRNVSVEARNRVGNLSANTSILVLPQPQSLRIHTDKRAYTTGAIITFLAVSEEPDPLEFLWHFGEGPSQRTTSRSIKKRYHFPGRYIVVVSASNGQNSFTSDIHPIVIQRKVQPNRLLLNASVLLNTTVTFDCRINAGTNVTYTWSFGDGTWKTGRNTEHHVYERVGEFTVEVTVSNLVSSAFLRRQIFVVSQPCQPPPVKNMGPVRIQLRRYQTMQLGVTYEGDINCNISQDLLYTWTLYDSTGAPVQLPPIETHQQSIQLPSHFLHYGIYVATARVHIKDTVVYSNYTVHIEVVPNPPVSLIFGGTNIFIGTHNGTVLILNGQMSYDPDYPENILSYQWHCKPVSNIPSTCFDGDVPASSPLLSFPSNMLKPNFDQFRFILTVRSGDRSSSSEVFVTVTADFMRKVHVYCNHCQGTLVNWNEQLSVTALCENCEMPPGNIFYTWTFHLVNSSSKVITEIPFCSVLDLPGPSRMVEAPSLVMPHILVPNSQTPEVAYPVTSGPLFSSSTFPSTSYSTGPGSQGHTVNISSYDDTAVVSVLSGTLVFTSLVSFSLPFYKDRETSVRSPRKQRSTETSSGNESSSDFGFVPPFAGDFKIPLPPYSISEFPVSDDASVLYDDPFTDLLAEFPVDSVLPTAFESRFPNGYSEVSFAGSGLGSEGSGMRTEEETSTFNYSDWGFFTKIEEAATGISRGRQTDIELGSRSKDFLDSSDREGNNLMDSSNPYLAAPEKTLLDLGRQQINPAEFYTYTTTGITSSIVTFKPFVLKPKSLYMLEVSASTQETMLGKTQFFFSTSDVPQGMACQVQPSRGYEIHTDFSIFCASGQADLYYEYSYSTGSTPRRVLYRGRDFQYYFSLPSGEPQDSYKVTVYMEVRNQFGAATRPCPVTVEVLPSYWKNLSSAYSPEKKLYLDGLENLAKLTQKGNGMEVRNHIFLLAKVLNRLSREPSASEELQTTTRSVLTSAICEHAMPDQAAMMDTIYILKDLISITKQVTFESARHVARFVRDMSSRFREQSARDTCFLDELTVQALGSLLSLTLEALVRISKGSTQLMSTWLTSDVIHTTSELLLKYVLFSQTSEYSLSTTMMELRTFLLHGSFQESVKNVGLTKFCLPDGLGMRIHGRDMDSPNTTDRCIVIQLMFFRQNPYFWNRTDVQVHGHVAGLTLYNCSTKTEIKVRCLSAPVTIEFLQKHQNRSGASQFCLQRSHMNIHQFNVTPENLQEALLITIRFIRPTTRTFPIMILLRNSERPTPALYKTRKIHHWEGDTAFIFLPLSSLNGPSRMNLALLNADYNWTHRNRYITSSVNYTVVIKCVQCLFWDGAGAWKADGCIPMQGQSSGDIKCSCNHLTAFTVAYREIQSHLEFICVSQFLSLPSNLMLCSAALISLVAYLLAAIICKGADSHCEEQRGSVHLLDNSPSDRQLYAVTVDTGFRSRPTMTAKVHIVLHGEHGISQTRELHVSDQPLFKRNSRHTFIISTPESLGPIWKVHLWHDSQGHSPSWYVSHVAVRNLVTGVERFFPGECWLAVDEGDGRVEKVLVALTGPLEFRKLLYSKLTEYLEDLHSWASVYSCPSYSRFTHVQRLSVCLLLLQGYMCANATLLSLQDHKLGMGLGLLQMSTVSLVTGILSTLVVLPVGALLSLLFRLSKITSNKESSVIHKNRVLDICSVEAAVRSAHSGITIVDNTTVQPYLSLQHLQQWTQGVWIKKYGHAVEDSQFPWQVPVTYCDTEAGQCNCSEKSRCSRDRGELRKNHHAHGCLLRDPNYGSSDFTLPSWCRSVAWTLCLTLSLVCAIVTAVLGTKFSATESLLWARALGFSLLLCGFVLQPTLILIGAVVVAVRHRSGSHFHIACPYTTAATEMQKQWSHDGGCSVQNDQLSPYHDPQEQNSVFSRVLAARRRARYLRLARPPTPAELRRVRGQMRKQKLIDKALREAVLCGSMLFLLLTISAGQPSANHYQLNQAIKSEFSRSTDIAFEAIQTREDWWNWTLTTLLDRLYWDTQYNDVPTKNRASAVRGKCVLIGEPSVTKVDCTNASACQTPDSLESLVPGCVSMETDHGGPALADPHHTACSKGTWIRVGLGLTRSAVASRLQWLRDGGWFGLNTRAVAIQLTLFNPPTGLFTAVSLLVEQPIVGGLLPSTIVQSTRVYQTTRSLDYAVMACELLFLLCTLLQFYFHLWAMSQQSFRAYWGDVWHWLEVTIVIISLFYFVCCMYEHGVAADTADLLQKRSFKAFVDVSFLCTLQQLTRSLHGLLMLLLLLKCVSTLRANAVMAPAVTMLRGSLSTLLCPVLTAAVLIMAFSRLEDPRFRSTSHAISGLAGSFQRILTRCMMVGAITSLSKAARKVSRRKDLVTLSEVAVHIRDRIREFTGKRKPTRSTNQSLANNFYLEEFEALVDELLFRLDAVMDGLQHTLPSEALGYEGSVRSLTPQLDCTGSLLYETCANGRHACKGNKTLQTPIGIHSGKEAPCQHHIGSTPQLKTFQQRESPRLAFSVAIKVSSPILHSDESLDASPSDGKNKSSGQCRPYNLAQLEGDLPHILCGSRCPGKQAAGKLCAGNRVSHKGPQIVSVQPMAAQGEI